MVEGEFNTELYILKYFLFEYKHLYKQENLPKTRK